MPAKKKKPDQLDSTPPATTDQPVAPVAPVAAQPEESQPIAPDEATEVTLIPPEPVPKLTAPEKPPLKLPTPATAEATSGDKERRFPIKKPRRPEVKPLKILETVSNDAGEVFQAGDKILSKAPWGARAVAEIKVIYEDDFGSTWAQYHPLEKAPDGWSWLGGVTRATRLFRAESEQ